MPATEDVACAISSWRHGWAGLLVVPLARPAILAAPFLPPSTIASVAGLAVTALGLALAIAARTYLAGNWSAAVEIKEGHPHDPPRALSLRAAPDLFRALAGLARHGDRARPPGALLAFGPRCWRNRGTRKTGCVRPCPTTRPMRAKRQRLFPSFSEILVSSTYCVRGSATTEKPRGSSTAIFSVTGIFHDKILLQALAKRHRILSPRGASAPTFGRDPPGKKISVWGS